MGSEPEAALVLVEAGTGEMPVSLALPHFGQNAELSAICVPQAEQNAITTGSVRGDSVTRLSPGPPGASSSRIRTEIRESHFCG